MASPTLDRTLLFLVAILLPLRIFDLSSRLLRGGIVRGRLRATRSVVLLVSVFVLLASIFSLSDIYPSERGALISEMEDLRLKTSRLECIIEESTQTLSSTTFHLEERDKLVEEMEKKIQLMANAIYEVKGSSSDSLDTEDRVCALEKDIQLLFDQSMMNADSIRSLESYADETKEKMEIAVSEVQKGSSSDLLDIEDRVRALEKDIQLLFKQSMMNADSIRSLESYADEAKEKMEIAASEVQKGSSSDSLDTEDRVRALEIDIQLLLEQSMMNADSIRSLESYADEAKEKMEIATSEVQKMENIVTEQWIQIRQLEQAFQSTKMTTKKVLKRNRKKEEHKNQIPFKETVSKALQFIRSIGHHASEVIQADSFFLRVSFSKSAIAEAYKQLKDFMSFVKKFHYELQDSIRHELKMDERTADLGDNFVVFCLASMMMTFPVVTTWIVSSWCFSFLKWCLTSRN